MSDSNKTAMISDDLKGNYLTFYVDDVVYGVELVNVIEIISIQAITCVPHVPEYVKGIINLRGKIVPVICIRSKFMLENRDYDDQTSIVVINYRDMPLGIVVDSVSDVVSVPSDIVVSLPAHSENENSKYLSTVVKIGDRLVLTLNLDSFFEADMRLST